VVEVLWFAKSFCLATVFVASVQAASASPRSSDLVSSFQMFCIPGPPDFAAIDAKATAMKLSVREEVGTPRQAGQFAHSKSWLVPLASGPHQLVAGETRGPTGETASCGIGAEDVDGEAMKQELVRAMKLDAPLQQTPTADGTQRVTVWKYGGDTTLLLADGTPIRIPGMYLTLLRQTNTSH
jgi:hypothetical protein